LRDGFDNLDLRQNQQQRLHYLHGWLLLDRNFLHSLRRWNLLFQRKLSHVHQLFDGQN
jgi:hypothetical protein